MKETHHSNELDLLENADNFRSILAQIGDGVYITDKNRKILFWNSACEEITGYRADEVTGKRCADNILVHIDMAGNKLCSTNLCPLHRAIVTGQPSKTPLTVRAKHKNGNRIVVEVSVAPVRNLAGTVVGGVETFRDVSGKIELEEEKARFFASLSHDLKTPLTNMQGYLDLLLEGDAGELNDIQKEFAETIYSEEQKLANLIEELLEMSRLQSADFSYEQNVLDLSVLIKKVVHSFLGEASRKGISLEEYLPENITVIGDGDRLWQAFSNLIGNAVKYTNRGKVEISSIYLPGQKEMVIEIKDTGIGIPPEDLDKIFKIFYRVDNNETISIRGTGIGLYIADSVIKRHEGRIEVKSIPGKGSIFKVFIASYNESEANEGR